MSINQKIRRFRYWKQTENRTFGWTRLLPVAENICTLNNAYETLISCNT